MTKPARKKEHRTESGERISVGKIPVAAPVEMPEERHRPRSVNRPAKATEEGFVTLGFRGTVEDDELLRRAVEAGGFYSKADLIRKGTMMLAEKTLKESGGINIRKFAATLGVNADELEAFLNRKKR